MNQPPARYLLWSLREDVHVETDAETAAVILHTRWGDLPLPATPALVREALRRMSLGPILLENITRDPAELALVERALHGFEHLVVRSIALDADRPLISVVPLTPEARFSAAELGEEQLIRLSRFALLRSDGSQYRLESSLALHRVILHRMEAVRMLAPLGRPARVGAVVRSAGPVPRLPAAELLSHLVAAGMVVVADQPAAAGRPAVFAEDLDPALTSWTPLDLMFHVRTSLGRHDGDSGMTYRREPAGPVEPVVAPSRTGPGIDLYRPRWPQLLAADPPFTAVVEWNRADSRPERPVPTAREVGELLYRAARVRSLFEEARDGHPHATLSDRPYVTSGSCHPFEVYLAGTCPGIPRGMYHYDPVRHRLARVPAGETDVGELLDAGRVGASLTALPPLVMLITARFRRLTWKYNGLSYSLVLKDLGRFVQTVLLVSTAMGIPAETVTGSEIELPARILGADWRTESAVAAVVVGAAPGGGGRPAGEEPVNDAEWADEAAALLARARRAR